MESVEDEWDRDPELEDTMDLLFVTYDAESVTIEEMRELIQGEGFDAEVSGD